MSQAGGGEAEAGIVAAGAVAPPVAEPAAAVAAAAVAIAGSVGSGRESWEAGVDGYGFNSSGRGSEMDMGTGMNIGVDLAVQKEVGSDS